MSESKRTTQNKSGKKSGNDMPETEILVPFLENRIITLVTGTHDQNLAYLEKKFDLLITAFGNHVSLRGPLSVCDHVKTILLKLYQLAEQTEQPLSFGDIDGVIREEDARLKQHSGQMKDSGDLLKGFASIHTRKRGSVKARTETQSAYIQALQTNEMVFAEGPAGTGKTWLAIGHAISLLEQGEVDRLILSRPAVEAGENLGFLPGDMREKVDPYLRPVYDALYDFMEARHVERGLQTGMIEIAPLAFMRGRTLANSVIVLDEAQNTTSMQMKMFLTRLGENSRMIITGDPSQIDLPSGQVSGLVEACRLLKKIEGIAHIRFTAQDVVRHDLVRRIVAAYDEAQVRRIAGKKALSAQDLPPEEILSSP